MPFRFFAFLCLISFTLSSQAQHKFIDNISIKGGFLYDEHEAFDNQIEQVKNWGVKKNYIGFNFISLGLHGQKEKIVYGLELEYSQFEKTSEIRFIDGYNDPVPDVDRDKLQGQIILYYGKAFFKSDQYQFILAPTLGMSYAREHNTPTSSFGFPKLQNKYTLGLGITLQNHFWIGQRIGFSLGTRFFLLDSSIGFTRTQNPALPLRTQTQGGFDLDLIRKEVLLQFGIKFKL